MADRVITPSPAAPPARKAGARRGPLRQHKPSQLSALDRDRTPSLARSCPAPPRPSRRRPPAWRTPLLRGNRPASGPLWPAAAPDSNVTKRRSAATFEPPSSRTIHPRDTPLPGLTLIRTGNLAKSVETRRLYGQHRSSSQPVPSTSAKPSARNCRSQE